MGPCAPQGPRPQHSGLAHGPIWPHVSRSEGFIQFILPMSYIKEINLYITLFHMIFIFLYNPWAVSYIITVASISFFGVPLRGHGHPSTLGQASGLLGRRPRLTGPDLPARIGRPGLVGVCILGIYSWYTSFHIFDVCILVYIFLYIYSIEYVQYMNMCAYIYIYIHTGCCCAIFGRGKPLY